MSTDVLAAPAQHLGVLMVLLFGSVAEGSAYGKVSPDRERLLWLLP